MREAYDETGAVSIGIGDSGVESIRISNRWKDTYSVEELAGTLTRLITELLPARPSNLPREEAFTPMRLPYSAVQSFIAEMREYRRAMARYRGRRQSGEIERPREERYTSPNQGVAIAYIAGRFRAVHLNPEWVEGTTVQALSDTLLDALAQRPLIVDMPLDPDREAARAHLEAAKKYLEPKEYHA